MRVLVFQFLCGVLLLVGALASCSSALAQQTANRPSLLNDMKLQIEITEAMNLMYNFKFVEAEKAYNLLKDRFPEHPMPYFLLGLNVWWQIMADLDNEAYDETFEDWMDEAIARAKATWSDDKEDLESAFFLAGAYGFKGRLYAERRNWGKAIGAGKNAMAYFRKGKKIDDMNVELLFGEALYNYFSVWIYDNYPILRPVIALFRKGDKALGLEQMQKVANNAFYTRTEAQYFLMRIYRDEEENPATALPIAKYLHNTFPENAYFHRSYAALNFILGYWDETLLQSNEILQRVQNQQAGYGAEAGRYASYFLGYIYQWQGDKARAKDFFMQAVAYAEQTGAYEYGYYHAALAYLARMAKESGNTTLAKAYYAKLNKHLERKGEYADEFKDETKEFLKAYKKVKGVME